MESKTYDPADVRVTVGGVPVKPVKASYVSYESPPRDTQLRVTKQQLTDCAKPKCKTCGGKGFNMVTRTRMEISVGGKEAPFTERTENICGCAKRRFAKRFRSDPEFRASLTQTPTAATAPAVEGEKEIPT